MDRKVSELCGKLYDIAKGNSERKFYSQYDKIFRKDMLEEAWRKVSANNGVSGIDNITMEEF